MHGCTISTSADMVRSSQRRWTLLGVVVVLSPAVLCFDGDAGSRSSGESTKVSKVANTKGQERTILPLLALWKLKPLLNSFSLSNFHGFGTFGFGGGGYNNYYYPGGFYPGFIPGALGAGAAGVATSGVAGLGGFGGFGYPGFPHPIGYPYPVIGGPAGQQSTVNKFRHDRIKPLQYNRFTTFRPPLAIEDPSRFDAAPEDFVEDEAQDEIHLTTAQPKGLMQSIREFASPLFHAGQSVQSRDLKT